MCLTYLDIRVSIVVWCSLGTIVGFVSAEEVPSRLVVEPVDAVEAVDDGLDQTDLILAFAMFRHGDRTPEVGELELFPSEVKSMDVFFPYGTKALTNKGKQTAYRVGLYLRDRYDGFISQLYLPDESTTRTTDSARTQMSALLALAGLFPPPAAQKWNPALDWQPVPYETTPLDDDYLLHWFNCPRYVWLKRQQYAQPDLKKRIKPYKSLFRYISERTGTNFTNPESGLYIDNLFQTMGNVGVKPPKWAQEVMPKIKELTKIEYAAQSYNAELIRLAAGVMLSEIVNATTSAIRGRSEQPKLRLYSAHENNVASLMAAARVFKPHQPAYGATFSIELRRRRQSGQFYIAAVYSPAGGSPAKVLPIEGCGGEPLCDYETFLELTQEHRWTNEEFRKQCQILA